MAAKLLPATADRSKVFRKVFDYGQGGVRPEEFVIPEGGVGSSGVSASGEVTLVAGAATVPATSVTSTSRIFLSRRTVGGTAGNMGFTRNAGVGFSITNSSNTDTSIVEWMVVN
jgi:hypothetical protein